jgi:cytochrome bd-type quinol oxidase subunit 2
VNAISKVLTGPGRLPQPRNRWIVPAALIFLSLIPLIAGGIRLGELAGGADITPRNERFFASPVPVVVHVLSVTVYSLLGAFQFVPSLRRGRRSWHRAAGRILIPAGLLTALTGLWMALFYALPPSDGLFLLILRLVFGTAMLASIVLAILAIRRRDFARHGAWMTRAYAIAVAAGTQALILIIPELVTGPPDVTTRAVLMGTAWVINLAIAEYAIRRRFKATAQKAPSQDRIPAPNVGA